MTRLKTFQDLGRHVRSIQAIRDELLAYLARYQQENPGQTPSIDCMINELGDAEALIRTALAALETRGDIHIISRFPLRISLTGSGLENVQRLAPKPEDPDRSRRFLEADGMRHQLGRFIGQTWKDKGRGPSLREMMDAVAYQNPGYVARMAEILAGKGLVQFGRGVPTKLTAAGQRFYGFEPKGETNMPPLTPTPVVIVDRRKNRNHNPIINQARVQRLCEIVARGQAEGMGPRDFRTADLAEALGLKRTSASCVRPVIDDAVDAGYLAVKPEPGLRGKKPHDFTFTELGRRTYLEPAQRRLEVAYDRPEPEVDQIEVTTMADDERQFEPIGSGTARMTLVANIPTADLVLELIERGYTVRKN